MLEFDDIPSDSGPGASATAVTATSSGNVAATSTHSKEPPNDPVSSILNIVEHGTAANAFGLGLLHGCAIYVLAMHALLYTRVHGRIV